MVARAKPTQLFSRASYETEEDFESVAFIESAPFLLISVEACISAEAVAARYYLLVYDLTEEEVQAKLDANLSPGRATLSWGPIKAGGTLVRDFPEPFRYCASCGLRVVRGSCGGCEVPDRIDVHARPFARGCAILLSTTPRLLTRPELPNAGGIESAMSIAARSQSL